MAESVASWPTTLYLLICLCSEPRTKHRHVVEGGCEAALAGVLEGWRGLCHGAGGACDQLSVWAEAAAAEARFLC